MKSILKLIVTFILTVSNLHSAEPTKHTYQGEVTGVVCAACSDHVKSALSKISGVESVKVLRGEKEGVNKLVVISTAASLTLQEVNKALGEYAKDYTITSLEPVAP